MRGPGILGSSTGFQRGAGSVGRAMDSLPKGRESDPRARRVVACMNSEGLVLGLDLRGISVPAVRIHLLRVFAPKKCAIEPTPGSNTGVQPFLHAAGWLVTRAQSIESTFLAWLHHLAQ